MIGVHFEAQGRIVGVVLQGLHIAKAVKPDLSMLRLDKFSPNGFGDLVCNFRMGALVANCLERGRGCFQLNLGILEKTTPGVSHLSLAVYNSMQASLHLSRLNAIHLSRVQPRCLQ